MKHFYPYAILIPDSDYMSCLRVQGCLFLTVAKELTMIQLNRTLGKDTYYFKDNVFYENETHRKVGTILIGEE